MKIPITKKAQVYGLSSFLYALAIAIVLVIGLLGMSKEFDQKSEASFYRFGSVITAKNAELIKKLLDQERAYATDKSMFITGAFGGYSPNKDLVKTSNCTLAEDSGCGYCRDFDGLEDCDRLTGLCNDSADKQQLVVFDCYANVKDPNGNLCGVKEINLPYLGEKNVVYWKNYGYNCIPDEEKIKSTLTSFAEFFGAPDPRITTALSTTTQEIVDFNYAFKLDDLTEDNIEVSWFPVGSGKGITISYPPDKKLVQYSFNPFVHTISKTDFFKLYQESKQSVENKEVESFLTERVSDTPIPVVVDEDFIVARGGGSSGTLTEKNCSTDEYGNPCPANDPFCGYNKLSADTNQVYCTQDQNQAEQPFKALVQYAETLPNTDIQCVMPSLDSVSSTYEGGCKIYTVRGIDGKLILNQNVQLGDYIGYTADCSVDDNQQSLYETSAQEAIDDQAARCVMARVINNINSEFGLGTDDPGLAPHSSEFKWRQEFYSFNLTFHGTAATNHDFVVYNKTQAGGLCGSECTDAELVNPDRYCDSTIDVSAEANISDVSNCQGLTTVSVDQMINVQRSGALYSDCRSVYPIQASIGTSKLVYKPVLTGNEVVTIQDSKRPVTIGFGHKFVLSWINLTTHPGDTTVEQNAVNLNPCVEPWEIFKVSINPTLFGNLLHKGGFDCVDDSDCAEGLICGPEDTCVLCGQADTTCCADDWCRDSECAGGICKCGNYTELCCPGETSEEICYADYTACNGTNCVDCGQKDQIACDNEHQGSNGCDHNINNLTNIDGICRCGGYGQPCCNSDLPTEKCVLRYTACDGINCVDCGQKDQIACDDEHDTSDGCAQDINKLILNDSSRFCECGGYGQPCCFSADLKERCSIDYTTCDGVNCVDCGLTNQIACDNEYSNNDGCASGTADNIGGICCPSGYINDGGICCAPGQVNQGGTCVVLPPPPCDSSYLTGKNWVDVTAIKTNNLEPGEVNVTAAISGIPFCSGQQVSILNSALEQPPLCIASVDSTGSATCSFTTTEKYNSGDSLTYYAHLSNVNNLVNFINVNGCIENCQEGLELQSSCDANSLTLIGEGVRTPPYDRLVVVTVNVSTAPECEGEVVNVTPPVSDADPVCTMILDADGNGSCSFNTVANVDSTIVPFYTEFLGYDSSHLGYVPLATTPGEEELPAEDEEEPSPFVPGPTSCVFDDALIELSQNKVCAGDQGSIIIFITNLENCRGVDFKVLYGADLIEDGLTTKQWDTTYGEVSVDKEEFFEGTSSIKWSLTQSGYATLKFEEPQDWSQYSEFKMKIYSDGVSYVNIDPKNEAGNAGHENKLLNQGWNDISYPISDTGFLPSDVKTAVKKIEFSVSPTETGSALYFDDIKLVKQQTEELASGKLFEDRGAAVIDVPTVAPETGAMQLTMEASGQTVNKTFKVVEKPPITDCFNYKGQYIDCAQACTDKPFERRWEKVLPTSLPMHFTYAVDTSYTGTAPSAEIECTDETFGLARGFVDCCALPLNCDCVTCEQTPDSGLWQTNSVYQDVVYGKQGLSPTQSLNDGNWPGIYFDPTTLQTAPPNDLSTNDIKAPEFPTSGCQSGASCNYETHNTTRYTYQWSVAFETVTTVFSEDEYVPMFVGYNQEPPLNADTAGSQQRFSGLCEGDSLCYTEVPMCGDGICDVTSGERCWNCAVDCDGPPDYDKGWFGDCTHDPKQEGTSWWTDQYGGCSRCPIAPTVGVADERGCVIQYKQEGENCTCNAGECGWGNPDSPIKGIDDQLDCVFKDIYGNQMDNGKCCHAGEIWDPDYEEKHNIDINNDGIAGGACVVKRELVVRDLQIDEVPKSSPEWWVPENCCGDLRYYEVGYSEATHPEWFDIRYTIENRGDADEVFSFRTSFESEVQPEVKGFTHPGTTTQPLPFKYDRIESDISLYPGNRLSTAEKSTSLQESGPISTHERIACGYDVVDYCKTVSEYINSTGDIVYAQGLKHTFVYIQITDVQADNSREFNGHNYPSFIEYEPFLICDTTPGPDGQGPFCTDGNTFHAPKGAEAICGGWAVPREMNPGFLQTLYDKPTWTKVEAWQASGIGCRSTKPNTWCAFALPGPIPIFGAMPCFVDCYYEGCG